MKHTCQDYLRSETHPRTCIKFRETEKYRILSVDVVACGDKLTKGHSGRWDFIPKTGRKFMPDELTGEIDMDVIQQWIDANKYHPHATVTACVSGSSSTGGWFHPLIKCDACEVPLSRGELDARFEASHPEIWKFTQFSF